MATQSMTVGAKSGSSPAGYKRIVYIICAVAALGGLLFGLDQGFIANSLATIDGYYKLGTQGGERYSAVLATGGIIGALLSGIFARFLGRKKSLLFAGFIFTAASALSAMLPSLPVLSACRFALGFGVGVASFVVPLYLAETAPASIRGSMGTLFQLMITIGIFLISLTNVLIARAFTNPSTSLPLMFLTITLFAALMFFGGFILPESPRWLMLKRRKEQAIAVLQRTLDGAMSNAHGMTLRSPGVSVVIVQRMNGSPTSPCAAGALAAIKGIETIIAITPAIPLTIALRRSSTNSSSVARSRASCSSNAVCSGGASSAP